MINREEIIKITNEHYKQFPVLEKKESSLQERVDTIYNELPNVYSKLSESKLLPEGMDLNIFMQVVLPRLEQEAQQAHIRQIFGLD